ncbi:MAG: DUF4097 family beta strand repeat protein [Lachnospiraceae bacterium]|nr:DUF4097 family beta strand repeat protein [Lachnospiraceae bacterium]
MKQVIKYAAVVFALVLAASIIGGCLTAGVGVVRMLVDKTEEQNGAERNGKEGNGLWYRDEDGDVVVFGVRLGNTGDVKSGTETFAASEIESIQLEDMSGELTVETWEQDYIEVWYEDIPEDYVIKKAGRTLVIENEVDFFFVNLSFVETPKIRIRVPADSVFEEVVIDKGSGSMKVSGITADVLEVDSGSGAVTISETDSEDFYVNSGSGSVNISRVNAEEISIDSGSGAVILSEVTAQNTILDSGSGTVTVKNSMTGETSVDTGSGFISFEEVTAENMVLDSGSGRVNYIGWMTGECVFETASGSVNLEVYGAEEDYNIRADLGSGGLYINGEKARDTEIEYADAENKLMFDTGSGRVSVKFNEK